MRRSTLKPHCPGEDRDSHSQERFQALVRLQKPRLCRELLEELRDSAIQKVRCCQASANERSFLASSSMRGANSPTGVQHLHGSLVDTDVSLILQLMSDSK